MRRSKTVKEDIPSYQSGPELLKGEARRIFLATREKPHIQVAYDFGLDRFYSTESSMMSKMSKTIRMVLDNPEEYDITQSDIISVEEATRQRSILKRSDPMSGLSVRQKNELETKSIVDTVTSARDLATGLLFRKLKQLDASKGMLKKESMVNLAKVAGILIDKGQILRGEATQNIAVLSKHIRSDMSAEDALSAIIKERESILAEKENAS